MTTLVKKSNMKNGGARYGLPGMRASAYFPPSMFVGEPPDAITVDEPSEQAQGPDGPLVDAEGAPVMKGLLFATEAKAAKRGTTGGTRVNAEIQKAREEAKRLREESKKVLKDARERVKAARKGGAGAAAPLVDEGTGAKA